MERTFDQYLTDTLPICKKENGWWLLAIPVRFMGGNHDISCMKTYPTTMGIGYLVAFDRMGEAIDIAYSFTIKKDGAFNSYNLIGDTDEAIYLKAVMMHLATIIKGLEETYPEMEVELEDPIELDISPLNVDIKVYIDMLTDKEVI